MVGGLGDAVGMDTDMVEAGAFARCCRCCFGRMLMRFGQILEETLVARVHVLRNELDNAQLTNKKLVKQVRPISFAPWLPSEETSGGGGEGVGENGQPHC